MFFNIQNNLIARFVLILVLLSGVFEAVPTRAQGTIYRVAPGGATSGSCGADWSNPCDLQYALTMLSSAGAEIWVAAGTYKPTSGTDRTISFVLKNGVAIYGGFAGTETARDQRNSPTNLTVLSGNIGVEGNSSDNSYHVLVGSNTDNSAILDGFTITGGNANDVSSPYRSGGGMYIEKGAPRLSGLIFTENHAGYGGGIYTSHTGPDNPIADLVLTQIVFRDNTATWEGGGLALGAGNLPSFTLHLSLTDVVFENNTAVRTGGGMINNGGKVELVDVTFLGNTAMGGGGLSHIPYGPSTLTNVTFSNNYASEGGGGILVGSGGPTLTTLTNVTFNNNSTALIGGGIANAGASNLDLTNVTFSGNTAGENGGGLSNGGIIETSGSVNLVHTTFSNNTTTSNDSAIYNEGGNLNIYNSILYRDTGHEIVNNAGTAAVTHSIIQDGYTGTGNLDVDPLLGPLQDNGGFTETMALGAGSPAIDAGDNANCPDADQRGMVRPQGAGCDMGTYEFQPVSTIHYVKWNATGANNGTSWANAYTDLQSALSAAASGDEIWVAAGTYIPGSDRTATFSLKDGAAMYGGFAGTETSRDQRGAVVNITVLSGDLNGNDNDSLSPSDPTRAENAFHVVSSSGVGSATILDGFTISSGNAYGPEYGGPDPEINGGGLWNVNGNPTLANLIFRDNTGTHGGGVYSSGDANSPSVPSLTNVVFTNNLASAGGGMHNVTGSNPLLTSVTFSDNSAAWGGGMYNSENSPTLTNVTFSNNSAGAGGGLYNNHGGSLTLIHVTVEGNSATNSASAGGAIFNNGTNITIYNSILYGNSGGEITNNTDVTNVSYSIVQGGYIGTGNLDQDPLLGPLQDNGGFTETMALSAGSPAIDAGDDVNCPATDQRGVSRPQGLLCDIGAYEFEQTPQPGPDFVVNTSADTNDGYCDLLGQGSGNQDCTLREAIHAANSTSDESEITFAADYTITLVGSQLPAVTTAISITGNGPAKTILQANAAPNTATYRVLEVRQTGNLTLSGLTVRHGRCDGSCATHGHSGGGIYNHTGALIVSDVTFSGNFAVAYGGGMYNDGSATLTNVTFNANTASYGGGIHNGYSSPTLTNITFSANHADFGGGMFNYSGSRPTLTNVTFSGNSANHGGGMFNDLNSNPTLINTLVANSTSGGDCVNFLSILNASSSNNLIEDSANACGLTQGVNGNIIGHDPNLAALADNGGATQTFALLAGSPTIDAGTDTVCSATDQRGVTRPQGTHCDVGAYEYVFLDSTVDVIVGDLLMDSYVLSPHESMRDSYVGVNDGPVRITNIDNSSMFTSERVIYKVNGINTSFSEMMGLPANQVDTTYWLPWYNNKDLDTQLRFANVTNSTATVHVWIGGSEITSSPFTLAAGESTRKSFTGVNAGPVKILSDQDIVAAERIIYRVNGVNTSFSEMMALANNQLDTTYYLPWYNNVDLDTQLRFANVSTQSASVRVYIGEQEMQGSPFTLAAGESTRKSFPGINNGPVKIVSDHGVPIVAAERVIYKVNGVNTSFSEMMALPNSQLDTTYWFPWYNNKDLDTQLRFANTTTSPATVHIYIGDTEMQGSPFTLLAGESTRRSFVGINSGPVKIISDVPIVAAERVIYRVNGVNTSFSEMMGLPDNLLDSTFWFPWYNNVDLDTQLRFGVP